MQQNIPVTRLVGWKQYLATQCATWIGNSLGVGLAIGGFVFLMSAVAILAAGVEARLLGVHFSVLFSALGSLCIWASTTVLHETDKIEPVALITRHNTGDLPEVETLVRGSNRPAAYLEAELLRSVRHEPGSSPEQLLRATID